MRLPRYGLALLLCAMSLSPPSRAQGEFVNYETPQVKPVTIARVGSGLSLRRFALLCNTPDNSVEIYEADSPFAFVTRVGVGLNPVTVRWNEVDEHFYTCNHLGDSVSRVRLELDATAPGGLRATLDRTVFVGDQPCDIVFTQNNTQAVVSLEGRSGVAHVALPDLSTVTPLIKLAVPQAQGPGVTHVAKMPRAMAVLPDNRFYALNLLGGDIDTPPFFDMGLYVFDPNNPPAGQTGNTWSVRDVGSTNFNFAIDSSGTRMFVCSQFAQNEPQGVDSVAAEPTGFVQSWLKVIELVPGLPGGPPSVTPEQIPGPGPKALWQSIDLNRDYTRLTRQPVGSSQSVAQPTDIVLVEDQTGVRRIVLAAFGSDKIVILEPDSSQPSGYGFLHVPLPLVNTTSSYSAVGPRGLAFDPDGSDPAGPLQAGLVWVENRLDNSFAIVNPWNGRIVAQRSLRNDPTPDEIRAGRTFLYSAFRTSRAGMVSCSSCHVDARTDGLVWNLGNLDPAGPPIPEHFHDGDGEDTGSMPDFPNAKGLMVTQTLQGLVNSHVEPYGMRFVTSNAPYHWRGDKFDFTDFNEAFVRLQGMPDEPTIPGLSGLNAAEMAAYHRFINTIHHSPNPEQRKDRRLGGSLGNPDDPDTGSGGKLGMKLFHIEKVVGARSCVHCHQLPEGSSNTLTLTENINGLLGTGAQLHPLETAAIRNLFQREIVVPNGFDKTDLSNLMANPLEVNGPYGLLHSGVLTLGVDNALSINDFVHNSFLFSQDPVKDLARKLAVTEFVRQFDTGTAPLIGVAWTVDPAQPTGNAALFQLLENQAKEANVGVAVYTRNNGIERGFWYDPRDDLYHAEAGGAAINRTALLALAAPAGGDNRVIAQATPTGSERRVASLTGTATVLTGPAPVGSSILLQPMAPNTFFVDVASLSGNWDPNHPTLPFVWNPSNGPEPVSLRSIRELQSSVAGLFGMPSNPLRHEPPRRLRVIGDNIRPGAQLGIGMATQAAGAFPVRQIWFDLAPTNRTVNGKTVWETAEELDPMHTMAWLNGGYWAPGVAKVMQADYSGVAQLAPATWNLYTVAVRNEDGTLGISPTWQPMTLQDGR